MKQKILKPVSEMPLSFDLNDWKPSDVPEDYLEQYRVDVDTERLERILEGADGKIEMNGDIVTRYMPECGGKSKVPMFLAGKWGNFYGEQYEASSGTHGISYEEGSKGFDKVNRLFSYTGANGTQIEEIWLLVYPQGNKILAVPEPSNPLPVVAIINDRSARGSKYIAIFVRTLPPDSGFVYVNDAERPLLVGYYLLEPNKVFRVPAYSLLNGAPDINTNQLMKAIGYVICDPVSKCT